ncbi:MAG: DNA/RNA non-specific endonuclease [Nannocystaceae bacterium]|nr:DNA/RNA non-specific endonuclease [Nannocystaceae bacterium]
MRPIVPTEARSLRIAAAPRPAVNSRLRIMLATDKEMAKALAELPSLPGGEGFGVTPATARALVLATPRPGARTDEGVEPPGGFIAEAIVLDHARPSLLVRNGRISMPTSALWRDRLRPHSFELEQSVSSVGRIELLHHDSLDWIGTGWCVGDRAIVTNRHVALQFARKKGRGFAFTTNARGKTIGARVDFREEHRTRKVAEVGVEKVLWITEDNNKQPDLALLWLSHSAHLPDPIALCASKPKKGSYVGVVGYPARDSRNDSDLMSEIFGDIYGVKRFAPGMITSVSKGFWFGHDASTLGGNSGSVVLDLETGLALGVHFGGKFHEENYAVKADTLKRVMSKAKLTGKGKAPKAEEEAVKDKPREAEWFADGREGYDPKFLGKTAAHRVPLPKLGRKWSSKVVKRIGARGANAHVIPYTHFSVVLCRPRKLPLFAAVNIDGNDLVTIVRKADRWYFDPRVPLKFQTGNEAYSNNAFDRGHMVRRQDPLWGGRATATVANGDTFHYTNAAPQHESMNQETWLSLEDYVLENAAAYGLRVSVFNGPVFADDDPEYRNIRLPQRFWKIAVLVDEDTGKLSATGYLLSQVDEVADTSDEFVYGEHRTYQVPIAHIENLTGLDFGKLSQHDPLKDVDIVEGREAASMRLIERGQDIVF